MAIHQRAIWIFVAMATAGIIASCGKDESKQRPPRHCSTAEECADETRAVVSESCQPAPGREGRPKGEQGRNFIQAFNFHNSRNILATIRIQIEYLNRKDPDNIVYKPALLVAMPKGSIRGGPENADIAGPAKDLGCEYVRSSSGDYLDHHLFSIESACFEDDPNCFFSPPPVMQKPTDDVMKTCEQECSSTSGKCMIYKFDETNPAEASISLELYKLANALTQSTLPTAIPINGLISALSGSATSCARGPLDIRANSKFTMFGDPCSINLPLTNTAKVGYDAAVLRIPSLAAGALLRTSASAATLDFESKQSIITYLYEIGSSSPVNDRISGLRFEQNHLTIAGQNRFCAQLEFNPG